MRRVRGWWLPSLVFASLLAAGADARGQPAVDPGERDRLVRDAERALGLGPFSVTHKTRVPPSGDRHDFISLAPYWWPDPAKPGGVPYIRKDGEVNPESRRDVDDVPLGQMVSALEALMRAYGVTADERYAARAALLLRVWFLDPATRMNPHLDYGQGVPGHNNGRAAGIIATRRLVEITGYARVLAASPAWTAQDQAGFKAWCEAYTTWLQTSRIGREEMAARNNHGTWYDAQLLALLLYTGKPAEAKTVVERSTKKRLASQIHPDGRQPEELARTRAWSYSVMNLNGWFTLARLAQEAGSDLWHHRTADGRSIRGALDFLVPYADRSRPWPYPQITPFETAQFASLLRMAAVVWKDEGYASLADRLQRAASLRIDVGALERERLLPATVVFLKESPTTVTASRSPRSAGGPHDCARAGGDAARGAARRACRTGWVCRPGGVTSREITKRSNA